MRELCRLILCGLIGFFRSRASLESIRSERQLMEQLDYNLLHRWLVGLSPDDPVWDPTTFTKNRDRLHNGDVFAKFMSKLLNHPQVSRCCRMSIFQSMAR